MDSPLGSVKQLRGFGSQHLATVNVTGLQTTHTQADRQVEEQTDRQISTGTTRQVEEQAFRRMGKGTDSHVEEQTDKYRNRQTGRGRVLQHM